MKLGIYRKKQENQYWSFHFLKKVPSLAKLLNLILSLRLQPSNADNLDWRIRYQRAADILDQISEPVKPAWIPQTPNRKRTESGRIRPQLVLYEIEVAALRCTFVL